jgi:hypothetical protein
MVQSFIMTPLALTSAVKYIITAKLALNSRL